MQDEKTVQLGGKAFVDESSFIKGLGLPERYEPLEVVGQGGMGVVIKALDRELESFVAVKIMNYSGAEQTQRFLREARALGQLNHGNIVQIKSLGVSKSGQAYQVAEFLQGRTLAAQLAERNLTPVEFKQLFLQLVSGLKYAAERGIVHRDIKPGNIFIEKVEGEANAKLLDFGIAYINQGEQNLAQSLTATGVAVGSPLYMSPEQCRGEKVGFLSDIYSLGCVMYECLTGAPPFCGETALETMYQQVSTMAEPIVTTQPEVQAIADLILRCLSKNPQERPQSYDEIQQALEALTLDPSDSMGITMSGQARSPKWKVPVAVVLLLFITAVAVGILIFGKITTARQQPPALQGPAAQKIQELEKSIQDAGSQLVNGETDNNALKAILAEQYLKLGKLYMSQVRLHKGFVEYERLPWLLKAKQAFEKSMHFAPIPVGCDYLRPEAKVRWCEAVLNHQGTLDRPRALKLIDQAIADFDKTELPVKLSQRQEVMEIVHWRLRARSTKVLLLAAEGDLKKALTVVESCIPMVKSHANVLSDEQRMIKPYIKAMKAENTVEHFRNLSFYAHPKTPEDKLCLARIYMFDADYLLRMGDARAGGALDLAKPLLDDTSGNSLPAWNAAIARYDGLRDELERKSPGAPSMMRGVQHVLMRETARAKNENASSRDRK